jgi:mono/diheme cytochrome c family protein
MRRGRWLALPLLVLAALGVVASAAVFALNHLDEEPLPADAPRTAATAEQVGRGEYLARAGHCAGCHTARGGAAYAGGGAINTPFGTVYAPNLTPDPATGLGRWSAAAFWRALHNGRSADGRLLSPTCPYPNFTRVTRGDSADLFAYLGSLPPVAQPNRPHALRFPYGTQPALAVWRALYFRPATVTADASQSATWNRGAYLVGGLGHCSACHGTRNAWGATAGALDLRGGAIPMQGWVAPALDDPLQAGVADWPLEDTVALLKSGRNEHASVSGPMAMVVARSTQHLNNGDLLAIATFLKSLPQHSAAPAVAPAPPAAQKALGAKVYEDRCAGCHGTNGEGARGAVPALAGNRAVTLASPDNLLKLVLGGAFAPATAGNPQPYGMPPFATLLSDEQIAAVASFVRSSWGHRASPVNALDVNRQRGG